MIRHLTHSGMSGATQVAVLSSALRNLDPFQAVPTFTLRHTGRSLWFSPLDCYLFLSDIDGALFTLRHGGAL